MKTFKKIVRRALPIGILLSMWMLFITSDKQRLRSIIVNHTAELSELVSVCQDTHEFYEPDSLSWNIQREDIYSPVPRENILYYLYRILGVENAQRLFDSCKNIFELYPFDMVCVRYDLDGNVLIYFFRTKPEGNEYRRVYLTYKNPAFQTEHPSILVGEMYSAEIEKYHIADNWYIYTRHFDEVY